MLWDMLWRGSLHRRMNKDRREEGDGGENGPEQD
jgi:hypothetical protein